MVQGNKEKKKKNKNQNGQKFISAIRDEQNPDYIIYPQTYKIKLPKSSWGFTEKKMPSKKHFVYIP